MKVSILCLQCRIENRVLYSELFELADSGAYAMKCSNGHETVAVMQSLKFQVLFELAVRAISDGYYREAVSSFASALERFYEFYVHIQREKHGIAVDAFESAWKHLSNSSERQLGAFIVSYSLGNGRAPSVLSGEDVNFRNKVVHKGLIPTRAQAMEFGATVASLVQPVLNEIRESSAEALLRVVGLHMNAASRKYPPTGRSMTVAPPAYLDLVQIPPGPGCSLEQWISITYTEDRWAQELHRMRGVEVSTPPGARDPE